MSRQQMLNFIAEEFESWLRLNERLYTMDGLELENETVVYPVTPPSRKQLETWVEILRNEH